MADSIQLLTFRLIYLLLIIGILEGEKTASLDIFICGLCTIVAIVSILVPSMHLNYTIALSINQWPSSLRQENDISFAIFQYGLCGVSRVNFFYRNPPKRFGKPVPQCLRDLLDKSIPSPGWAIILSGCTKIMYAHFSLLYGWAQPPLDRASADGGQDMQRFNPSPTADWLDNTRNSEPIKIVGLSHWYI